MKIKPYREADFLELVKCLEGLQDYLSSLDSLKRLRRLPDYGQTYAANLLKKVKEKEGKIYLAEEKGKIIGCIVGIIKPQSKNNLLECIPTKDGRIVELYVHPELRSLGVGKKLMQEMEKYFQQKKCTVIRVEVFAPNLRAKKFYQQVGYHERVVDLMKVLH